MKGKFGKVLEHKVFKRRLWEGLTVGLASLLVLGVGGYNIAMSQSAAINHALNIAGSSIERSDDEQYKYFKSDYASNEYDKLQSDYLALCEEIEGEGLVLMKNDNGALPLAEGDKVSTFLTGSVLFNYATSGSSSANTEGYADFKTALTSAGLAVNSQVWDFYKTQTEDNGYGRKKKGTLYTVNEVPYSELEGSIDRKSVV